MKRILYAVLVSALIGWACTDRDDELTTANIRIKNNTNSTFNLVEVIADSLFYENIPSDGFSQYLSYDEAFESMPFRLETDSLDLGFTPEQMILEPLPVGLYTYEISFSEEGAIVLNFKVD